MLVVGRKRDANMAIIENGVVFAIGFGDGRDCGIQFAFAGGGDFGVSGGFLNGLFGGFVSGFGGHK